MGRFLLLVLFLAPWTLGAAPVSTLSSLDGEVTVLRGGVLIPSEKVGEGFGLEAFDTVSTGSTGRAEIRLAGLGLTGSVRLDSETSLYLDLSSLKREQTAGIELLTGGVTIRLSAVSGASMVEVRTEGGVFGGAGGFRVVLGPAGDVLVTSSAGKVQCQGDNRTVFIEPGSVAEALALDRSIKTMTVTASTQDSYETSWLGQRRKVFGDQAVAFFRPLASRYQLQIAHFQRAWDRVQREGPDGPLEGAVANLRRAAFPLERSLYRVAALAKLLDEGVLSPSVELSRGYPAQAFFRQATLDRALWAGRLAEARGLYKTLANLHGGDFPKASEGAGITYDSEFFH